MKASTKLAISCFITSIVSGAICGVLLLVAPSLEFLQAVFFVIAFLSMFYAIAAIFGQNWLGNQITTYTCPHCHKKIRFSDFEANAPFSCVHCGKPIIFSGEF